MPTPDPPTLSVVMPVHNGAAFLERASASVISQTYPHWELIAVDDASTDDTPNILANLSAHEPRLRVHRHPHNAGVAATCNTALRQARGVWVLYLDCDDEFDPAHLARVAAWPGSSEVLIFQYDIVDERTGSPAFGTTRRYDPREHHERLLYQNIVIPLGVAHRRTLLDRVGLFDESMGRHSDREEDTDLWRRFAAAGAAFTFVAECAGRYHVRANSLSRTRPPSAPTPSRDDHIVTAEVAANGSRHRLRVPRADVSVIRSVFEGHEYGGLPMRLLRSPPVVWDVGANVGAFALYAKLFWHRDALVHGFEPHPPSHALLQANLNGWPNTHLHPFALADREGEAILHLHPELSVCHSLLPYLPCLPVVPGATMVRQPVPVRDAGRVWDELGMDEVDVLKIDAEGSEVPILQSLGERLSRTRIVMAEFHTRADRRRIDAILAGHDLFATRMVSADLGVVKYLHADLAARG